MLAESSGPCSGRWDCQGNDGEYGDKGICWTKTIWDDQRRNLSWVGIINRAIKQAFDVCLRRF